MTSRHDMWVVEHMCQCEITQEQTGVHVGDIKRTNGHDQNKQTNAMQPTYPLPHTDPRPTA